jgi:hypothetical protein
MSAQFRVWRCLDEQGELMRVVKHKEEALQIIAIREGWTIQCTLTQKKNPEYIIEDAPF